MKNRNRKSLGFSLIELMIVIAIIGVLIAVAVPSYRTYMRRAHYLEIVQATAPYKLGVQECYQMTSYLTDCVAGKHGIPPAINSGEGGGLVQSISVADNGVIEVTPATKYGITAEDTYILTPEITNNILTWSKSGGGVNQGYAN